MEIDPVPKCLDDGDDARPKRAPGYNFKITGQGPEGQAAELAQKPAIVLEEYPQHLSLDEVIPFVLNFFAAPLKGFVPIPPAIVVLIMTGGSMLILRRKKSFMNYLLLLAFSGTIFSILGAMRMPGNLLPYVLKFESSLVALLYFSCIAGALR